MVDTIDRARGLDRDVLAISGHPTPGTGAVAAFHHALLVDLDNHLAIAREQRLGRADLGAKRQLAFGEAVGTIFGELLGAP